MLPERGLLQISRYTETESDWKKIFHTNDNEKKAGVAIFISDKIGRNSYMPTNETT